MVKVARALVLLCMLSLALGADVAKSETQSAQKDAADAVAAPVVKTTLDTGDDLVAQAPAPIPQEPLIAPEGQGDARASEVDKRFFLLRWTGLLFFVVAVVLIASIVLLILLSVYYRAYMFKTKSAPFEAPRILQAFFPKPTNYEHEITVLCSKYMNN